MTVTTTWADAPAVSVGTLRTSPCSLCPRLCGANRDAGQAGVCGAGADMLVARAALHFWEEPCLSGERGSGAVFFSHCPLKCVYCQNAVIAAGQAGLAVSTGRLSAICLELQEQGALNVNFVTPTHYTLQVRDAVARARERGFALPVVWNTSGYEREEAVGALAGTVDVYLPDFKYADSDLAKRYSHASDYPAVALAAIRAMVDQVGEPEFDEVDGQPRITRGVVVRHLLLPGALEQSKAALSVLYNRFGNSVLYSIMNQYTPVLADAAAAGDERARRVIDDYPQLSRFVSSEEYEQLLDFADSIGLEDYYWQDGPAAAESFIPAWDCTGVSKM